MAPEMIKKKSYGKKVGVYSFGLMIREMLTGRIPYEDMNPTQAAFGVVNKLLHFAELKHNSISFFNIEKHETVISSWSRATTRAAKVGNGLSKDDKAQKLALQHWLEAVSHTPFPFKNQSR
ncbi:hypothetical protein AAZX31_15G189200 [Glycine max]